MEKKELSKKKALIIRFSSFGDIVQSSFVAESLTDFSTDLLTKSEFSNAFKNFSVFENIISYNKRDKNHSLFKIAKDITKKNYDIIYDAHNNQRTLLLKILLILLNPLSILKFKTRSKYRFKRLLLFKFRINLFPKPFKGAESFLSPLGLNLKSRETDVHNSNSKEKPVLLFAPSAAWELKKWPVSHWIDLSNKLKKENLDICFLGGPDDHFIQNITDKAAHTTNLAGKLSWSETIEKIKGANLLVSGDTGVLHIADFYKIPAIALMGPSAFGYPSRESSKVISLKLPCQPCSKDGRGKCKIKETKKCLTHISADMVLTEIQLRLKK